MIVETLGIQCFLGYRDLTELDFTGKKVIGIAGANEAGKSTILRAIRYGIYGRAGASREINLLNDNADAPLVVRVGLRLPSGRLLEIERVRTRKNEAMLSATGIAGKPTEVQAEIQRVVQLDPQDFVDLSYFVQGDIHGFMEGDKRSYFRRWTRSLKWWSRLEDEAKKAVSDLEVEIDTLQHRLDQVTSVLDRETDLRSDLDRSKNDLNRCQRTLEIEEGRHDLIQSRIRSGEVSRESKLEVASLNREARDVEQQLQTIARRRSSLQHELQEVSAGQCPILKTGCQALADRGKVRRKAINVELGELRDRRGVLDKRSDEIDERVKMLAKRIKRSKASSLTEDDLDLAKRKVRAARSEVSAAEKDVAKAEAVLGLMADKRTEADQIRAKMNELEPRLSRARFVAFMCGRSGVPSTLIESELDNVEKRCNWILDRLGYPKRIRFQAFKELAGYEAVCPRCGGEQWRKQKCASCGTDRLRKRKDEPTVTILDGKRERPFELESGGGRVLQSFAVRLAASFFVSSLTGAPLHLLMLDEVFAMLDQANRQKLMALVMDKLITEFGIRQQFVVSHHDDVVNAVDDLLLVSKKRGQAHVEWA